jgi:hypothetical protein
VVQEESNKIYFIIFGHSYKFLRILEICTNFWNYLTKTKKEKGFNSAWTESGPWLQFPGRGSLRLGRTTAWPVPGPRPRRRGEAGRRGADKWGRQHNAPNSVFKPNQVYFKRI